MALHCGKELWQLRHSWYELELSSHLGAKHQMLTRHRDEALHLLLPGSLRDSAVQDAIDQRPSLAELWALGADRYKGMSTVQLGALGIFVQVISSPLLDNQCTDYTLAYCLSSHSPGEVVPCHRRCRLCQRFYLHTELLTDRPASSSFAGIINSAWDNVRTARNFCRKAATLFNTVQ